MIYRMKLADSVDEMTFDLLEVPIEDKDIEGATDNTTIDGNIFTDYLWLKKQFVQKWSLMCKDDYTQLRGFYTRQWENAEAPTYTLFAGQNRSETLTASGSAFRIQNGTQYDAPLTLTELKGNATQNGTPTPDAPVVVNTTTGENVVKITGKNLINENGERSSQYIDNAGNFVSGVANGYVNQQLPTKPNTAYTFSASSKTTQQVYLRIGEYRADGSFIKRDLITSLEQTITTDAECYIIKTCIDVSTGNHFTNPQLELGSTSTSFEPYHGQEFEVNLGKNLLNLATFVKGRLDNGVLGYQDGTSVLEATATDITFTTIANFRGITSDYIQVVGGSSYIQNQELSANNNIGGAIAQYDSSKTFIRQDNLNTGMAVLMQATTAYVRIYYFARNAGTVALHEPQLEKSSTATDYAPYFTPIELAKIGTYQDRIYKQDGKWYLEKQIKKMIYTGASSETWNTGQYGTNSYHTTALDRKIPSVSGGNPNYTMSNLFKGVSFDDRATGGNNIIYTDVSTNLYIRNTNIASLADLRTLLSTNNLVVYYVRATPTTTEITDSTLLAQLNFIANLYGGTNNIMLVGTGAQGEIGVEYTLTYEKEQTIIPETTVRLTLTDGGVINTCECRQNVQLTMRETVQ